MEKPDFYDLVCEWCKAQLRGLANREGVPAICNTCRDRFPQVAAWLNERKSRRKDDNEFWTVEDILRSVG